MNQFIGEIIECTTDGSLSLIQAQVNGVVITSIVIDDPEQNNYLQIGKRVRILCKETEVIIAKEWKGKISLQNQLSCEVINIEVGKLLCKVNLKFHQESISSVITRKAFDQLDIQEKDSVLAMIKTNEITLAPYD